MHCDHTLMTKWSSVESDYKKKLEGEDLGKTKWFSDIIQSEQIKETDISPPPPIALNFCFSFSCP